MVVNNLMTTQSPNNMNKIHIYMIWRKIPGSNAKIVNRYDIGREKEGFQTKSGKKMKIDAANIR